MAKGDLFVSPWLWQAGDYVGLLITIRVDWDNTTRALLDAVVHRDSGCQYHTIVFDVPSSPTSKRLAAPADGAADVTYTANQLKRQGLNTIDDVLALQITAEP